MISDPVLKIPVDINSGPAFLPDPKDGSLYAFGAAFDGLKKLPFTIPELVTASPCKSSDGILYTGNTIPTIWYLLCLPEINSFTYLSLSIQYRYTIVM